MNLIVRAKEDFLFSPYFCEKQAGKNFLSKQLGMSRNANRSAIAIGILLGILFSASIVFAYLPSRSKAPESGPGLSVAVKPAYLITANKIDPTPFLETAALSDKKAAFGEVVLSSQRSEKEQVRLVLDKAEAADDNNIWFKINDSIINLNEWAANPPEVILSPGEKTTVTFSAILKNPETAAESIRLVIIPTPASMEVRK